MAENGGTKKKENSYYNIFIFLPIITFLMFLPLFFLIRSDTIPELTNTPFFYITFSDLFFIGFIVFFTCLFVFLPPYKASIDKNRILLKYVLKKNMIINWKSIQKVNLGKQLMGRVFSLNIYCSDAPKLLGVIFSFEFQGERYVTLGAYSIKIEKEIIKWCDKNKINFFKH